MREIVDANLGHPVTALAARGDTLTMRDQDPKVRATIDQALALDEANARREFFCDDSSSSGDTFLDHQALAACVDRDRALVLPSPRDARCVRSIDLGLVRDSSTSIDLARVGDKLVLLEADELRPAKGEPLKLSRVIAHFAEGARRRGLRRLLADHHAIEPAKEFAQAEGITIEAAPGGAAAKEQTFLALRSVIHERRISLPDHPRLLDQLRSVVAKPVEGGGLRITMPRRAGLGHGDLVAALAIGVAELTQPVARVPRPRPGRDPYRWAGPSGFGSGRGF